jgi:crotonobetainyl-CoA:carnitine CoA-transferase CaiB-like acyl-CoA transferase
VKVVEMCQMISGTRPLTLSQQLKSCSDINVRNVCCAGTRTGPLGAQYLADQGADVIKVENGNGAGDRFRGSATIPSPAFAFANRGKRSVTLDTKQEAGIAALKKLMRNADVFLQNFRPGVAERMGIGYDAVKRLNPAIIYVSISGFGADGPCKCSLVNVG